MPKLPRLFLQPQIIKKIFNNSYLFTAICGLIYPFAFAPFQVFPLAFLSLIGLCYLFLNSDKSKFLIGFIFGLCSFGTGVAWVYISLWKYGSAHIVFAIAANIGLVIYLSLFPAFAGFFVNKYSDKNSVKRLFFIPLFLTLAELLRAYLISGFPWLSAGYSQLYSPLKNFAPLGGVFLISFVLYLSSSLFAFYIVRRKIFYLCAFISFLLISIICGFIRWTENTGEKVQLALVQGNIAQYTKFNIEQMGKDVEKYIKISNDLKEKIIIWPETAIPFMADDAQDLLADLDQVYKKRGQTLIVGIPSYGKNTDIYYNSLLILGDGQGKYSKDHLLPFGEYIPMKFLFSFFLKFVDIPLSDFSRGGKRQEILTAGNNKIAASICFEGAFGRVMRNSFLPESDFLVNISNDGWFSGSRAAAQHLEMQQMRSIELGRDLARATNDGITATIAANGKIRDRAPVNEEFVLSSFIEIRKGLTPYARFGNWLIFGFLFIYFALIAFICHKFDGQSHTKNA
ncbi:MAG: apolipoprotein N-acyltransferase [Cardiobacteriaceae bacterium]|nr:apolipoprotein N-acyltransferase [Cardiobacteriaceae bacterium]